MKNYGMIKIWGFSEMYQSIVGNKLTLVKSFLKPNAISKPDSNGELCYSLNTDFEKFEKVVFQGKCSQISMQLPKLGSGSYLLAYFNLYSHPKKLITALNKIGLKYIYIPKGVL